MKNGLLYLCLMVLASCHSQNSEQNNSSTSNDMDTSKKYNELTPDEERVIIHKGTDRPFTGDYYQKNDNGIYICRRCNNPLYTSEDKFDSDRKSVV